jgi:hypothetical protein
MLRLNVNSSFMSTVSSVTLDTDERQVIIDLKRHRRCDNPTFMVRLSGTALYLLNLTKQEYEPAQADREHLVRLRQNTLFYSYPPIQDTGTYFLEVLALLCESFRPHSLVGHCVEDSWQGRNVITAANSFILKAETPTSMRTARWVLGDLNHTRALPTRIKERECIGYAEPGSECDLANRYGELWQHNLYNWVDSVNWTVPYHKLGSPRANICFVGASHARNLAFFGNLTVENTTSKLTFLHVESHYPANFSLHAIKQQGCDYSVVSYGQWPVAWVTPVPYNEEHYRHAMGKVFNEMAHSGMKMAVRSVNYNGLGLMTTECPMLDHRIPPVIDMMNRVLSELSVTSKVPYIDTNHIMGPMWDSALDYCHPGKAVFTAEVEWILHFLFSRMAERRRRLA